MKVELIPVIEVAYFNHAKVPENGPNWEYQDDWEEYGRIRLRNAGFIDDFASYEKGSSFYEPYKISPANLKKLIYDWLDGYDESTIDDVTPFYGGYILKVDGIDVYFPQCCGDLGGIWYWENIIYDSKTCFYNGHPAPQITFSLSQVTFTFDNTNEEFAPPVPKSITLDVDALKQAYQGALEKLKEFERVVMDIEPEINIDLYGEKLTELLIYRNKEIVD